MRVATSLDFRQAEHAAFSVVAIVSYIAGVCGLFRCSWAAFGMLVLSWLAAAFFLGSAPPAFPLATRSRSRSIDIGNYGVAGESGNVRIGTKGTHKNVHFAGISGVIVAAGVNVIVDTPGRSFRRSVTRIRSSPMDKASEAVLALRPVTFRYKRELDPAGIPQFGLVAEQVEKVNPDLVARDEQGKPYTLR